MVVIEEAGEHQGTNTWDGVQLKKSSYDPLEQANKYTDEQIEQVKNIESYFIEKSDTENLYEWKDNLGNVVLALNKKSQLVSYDENKKRSILLTNQEDIKELQKFVDELNLNNISVLLKLLATSDSSDLYTFDDSDGNIVLRLTKNGMLRFLARSMGFTMLLMHLSI